MNCKVVLGMVVLGACVGPKVFAAPTFEVSIDRIVCMFQERSGLSPDNPLIIGTIDKNPPIVKRYSAEEYRNAYMSHEGARVKLYTPEFKNLCKDSKADRRNWEAVAYGNVRRFN